MITVSELQQVKNRFGIIGSDLALNRALEIAVQVAPTDLSVLVTGESGVGKENVPRIIHAYSVRKHNPYIAVNCGAIPEGTIDSELFGHEKGAFTGAVADRKGYFEEANGGTIFLDEIGEMPMQTQARLLRVLEAGEFIKVGSSKVLKTNVRIIAATNVDIPRAIKEGRFREDLFYRLNSVPVSIPPLRQRKGDIVMLFRKFVSDFAEKYSRPVVRLLPEAQELLCQYSWPGNIRQLKNVAEQVSILSQEVDVSASMLSPCLQNNFVSGPPAVVGPHGPNAAEQGGSSLGSKERDVIYQLLFDMRNEINQLKSMLLSVIDKPIDDSLRQQYIDSIRSFDPAAHQASIPAAALQHGSSWPDDGSSPSLSPVLSPSPIVVPAKSGGASKSITGNIVSAHNVQDTVEVDEVESRTLQDVEKETIKKALERHGGRRSQAAADLNISTRTLYRKLIEYDLK